MAISPVERGYLWPRVHLNPKSHICHFMQAKKSMAAESNSVDSNEPADRLAGSPREQMSADKVLRYIPRIPTDTPWHDRAVRPHTLRIGGSVKCCISKKAAPAQNARWPLSVLCCFGFKSGGGMSRRLWPVTRSTQFGSILASLPLKPRTGSKSNMLAKNSDRTDEFAEVLMRDGKPPHA